MKTVEEKLTKLEQYSLRIDELIRRQRASACRPFPLYLFELANQHLRSIAVLTGRYHYASAWALQRVFFESLARALWFLYCATPDDLYAFKADRLDLKVHKMRQDLESRHTDAARILAQIWQSSRTWHGFTHTGYDAVVRHVDAVGDSLSDELHADSSRQIGDLCHANLMLICLGLSQAFPGEAERVQMLEIVAELESMDDE